MLSSYQFICPSSSSDMSSECYVEWSPWHYPLHLPDLGHALFSVCFWSFLFLLVTYWFLRAIMLGGSHWTLEGSPPLPYPCLYAASVFPSPWAHSDEFFLGLYISHCSILLLNIFLIKNFKWKRFLFLLKGIRLDSTTMIYSTHLWVTCTPMTEISHNTFKHISCLSKISLAVVLCSCHYSLITKSVSSWLKAISRGNPLWK